MAGLPWRSNGGLAMAVERRACHGGRTAVLPWRSNGGLAIAVCSVSYKAEDEFQTRMYFCLIHCLKKAEV